MTATSALTRATEVATEGAAAVYRRQQEIMQAAGEQVSAMVRDIKLGTEQQAEVAKRCSSRRWRTPVSLPR